MFPSFSRSSKGSPMFLYSLAILTTKLRFDLTRSWYVGSPDAASFIRRAMACSCSLVRSGYSLISCRYLETQVLRSAEPFAIGLGPPPAPFTSGVGHLKSFTLTLLHYRNTFRQIFGAAGAPRVAGRTGPPPFQSR